MKNCKCVYSRCLFSFLDIVACLRLGTVGRFIDGVVIYLLGNFAGLFYGILVLLSGYVLFSAKLPQLGGPKQVGCYLLVAALMILASAPADHTHCWYGCSDALSDAG